VFKRAGCASGDSEDGLAAFDFYAADVHVHTLCSRRASG
jgi:hypothetical protein